MNMNEGNEQKILENHDETKEEKFANSPTSQSCINEEAEESEVAKLQEKDVLINSENQESELKSDAVESKKSSKDNEKQVGSKGELNQEDIFAVQFLASEFNKETSATKINEPKIQEEIETIDANVLDVAATQSIVDDGENLEQSTAVATLNKEMQEDDSQQISPKPPESQSKKRKIKPEDRQFKCGFCDKSFSMKIALEKHLVVHGAKLPWQCCHCSEAFMKSSDYKEHCNKVHNNYRPFPCNVCGKRLSNLGILKNHQGIHSGDRPFACQFTGCEKSFLTKTNLDDHERKHVNAREFECETCHKRFNLKGDLRQHEKVHKEDKPFRCEFCDMSFPRGPSLWRHRRTHTGEKPYQCDICEKRFSRMENCQEHRRIHTGERPLVCAVCGKAFRDSGNFSNHKKIHQEGYIPRKKRIPSSKRQKEIETPNVSEYSEQKCHKQNKDESITEQVKPDAENEPSASISQDVAFIVAPMQVDQGQENIAISTANAASESSYVQVGNFYLTLEMEAAFKQIMQQQGGSNEFVTLTMTDGKSLEFISDASQAEALMQAAASQSQTSTEIQLQDVQDVIKSQTDQMEVVQSQNEVREEASEQAVESQIVDNTEIP